MMGTKVMAMTKTAATLVSGRFRGLNRLSKIQMGRVCWPGPWVNWVTMISSKDRAKASIPPASRAVPTVGSRTRRRVCTPDAPRSWLASTTEPEVWRSRASALL